MSNLHRHLCLMGSLDDSIGGLARYLKNAIIDDRVTISLRPVVRVPDLGVEVVLQRDIIVIVDAAHGVSWMPSDRGAYPRFTGRLQVVADEPERSRLVLVGDAGVVRSGMGYRFNQGIARDLLRYLADHIS